MRTKEKNMATPQLSPGVLVRELDLTVGRVENVVDTTGALAGPFRLGPVEEPIRITSQQQYIDNFGKPLSTDRQYEYWMTGSEFLSYGGVLSVTRVDGDTLNNANAGTDEASSSSLKIKNFDDYESAYSESTEYYYAARNPGAWGNGIKVCQIDAQADQRLTLNTANPAGAGVTVGYGVTMAINTVLAGSGTTSVFTGYLKGIITGVSTDSSGSSTVDVKVVSRVHQSGTGTTVTNVDYEPNNMGASFPSSGTISIVNSGTDASPTSSATTSVTAQVDWYDQQNLGLTNSTVLWKSIAPRPRTSNYASTRGGRFDTMNIAIVDDNGGITGSESNILEKYNGVSKAKDATFDAANPVRSYYKKYISNHSAYIFVGDNPSTDADTSHGTVPAPLGFSTNYTANTISAGLWGQDAASVTFSGIGPVSYTMAGGVDYSASGGMSASLGNVKNAYELYSNKDDESVDFLLMGPSCGSELESQAKANLLISIANSRKDCIAVISPHRANVVNVTSSTTQTTNVVRFFSALTSSSFAVFDSGYKYVYDRFNDEFRYLPCNGDIAGLMVRTGINAFPWFSPAGQQRGALNNAVKLAYNPDKDQRDTLYSARINPIVSQGSGPILFGDKTGLSYASAFDRINVRRLFITVETALESAAQSQLFEINDADTRDNFVNIVTPFLRDIQANRGIENFKVICDASNNTPDVIDNNEFRADIFIQPTRSINYISLTFIATRSGITFSESV